jgi:CheY-like chemotaxis protein
MQMSLVQDVRTMACILVVDEDPSMREFLQHVLEEGQHSVLTAADGEQALRLARGTHLELIITDIIMPVRDGSRSDPSDKT